MTTAPRYSLEELEEVADALDLTLAELVEDWQRDRVLPGIDDDDEDDFDEDDFDEEDE